MTICARGSALTLIARMHGVRRRWLGLEPDCLLRQRIVRALVAPLVERAIGVSWRRWQWLRLARRLGLR